MNLFMSKATNIYVVYGRVYVYSIQYHIVWCVKHRRKVLDDKIEQYIISQKAR